MSRSGLLANGKTRAMIAAELWARLQRGPHFGPGEAPLTPAEASSRCRGWIESWILTEVATLVPELREKLDSSGFALIDRPAVQREAQS